jgi:hypothetical protein
MESTVDAVIIIPAIRAGAVEPLVDYNTTGKGTAGTRLDAILAWCRRSVATSISQSSLEICRVLFKPQFVRPALFNRSNLW